MTSDALAENTIKSQIVFSRKIRKYKAKLTWSSKYSIKKIV